MDGILPVVDIICLGTKYYDFGIVERILERHQVASLWTLRKALKI